MKAASSLNTSASTSGKKRKKAPKSVKLEEEEVSTPTPTLLPTPASYPPNWHAQTGGKKPVKWTALEPSESANMVSDSDDSSSDYAPGDPDDSENSDIDLGTESEDEADALQDALSEVNELRAHVTASDAKFSTLARDYNKRMAEMKQIIKQLKPAGPATEATAGHSGGGGGNSRTGTRQEVWKGSAKCTAGKMTRNGMILPAGKRNPVSLLRHDRAKSATPERMRPLVAAQYTMVAWRLIYQRPLPRREGPQWMQDDYHDLYRPLFTKFLEAPDLPINLSKFNHVTKAGAGIQTAADESHKQALAFVTKHLDVEKLAALQAQTKAESVALLQKVGTDPATLTIEEKTRLVHQLAGTEFVKPLVAEVVAAESYERAKRRAERAIGADAKKAARIKKMMETKARNKKAKVDETAAAAVSCASEVAPMEGVVATPAVGVSA